MVRFPVVVAVVAALLLTSCAGQSPVPAEPIPEGSEPATAEPTTTPDPVAESPYLPCDETTVTALMALYPGELADLPAAGYPEYLPLPSCLLDSPDFELRTAIFLGETSAGATQADFDALESAIADQQGPSAAAHDSGLTTSGREWEGGFLEAIFLVPASFGVDVPYIVTRSVLTG